MGVVVNKCYIIHIDKQDNETINGTVEDVEQQTREKFSNSSQLWSLIGGKTKEESVSDVIHQNIYLARYRRRLYQISKDKFY